MKHSLSTFGRRLGLDSGIGELMQDLGEVLASGDESICMLGGGQPAHIPEVDRFWQERLQTIAADPNQVASLLGDYQPPGGDASFRESVAQLFRREYGWPIDGENVCITAGGQTALFLLLNALAGRFDDGTFKQVLLPIVPEYIGYADQSTSTDLFHAVRPKIEMTGPHEFKYHIDFESLQLDDSIAAICLSRPTNPSANVIGNDELGRLAEMAVEKGIPLIVDNAYGDPFPGVIFTGTTPIWNSSMVLTYSLSKLGLPGTRTGIVIADPEIIAYLSSMNAITSLANNNIGQSMIQPLIESGEILSISRDVIRPFYRERSWQTKEWLCDALDDSVPYRIHRSEGAFFLWLWLEGLPITSAELYTRLKRRGVLVISGHYFFFGLDDQPWKHRDECLRISFTTSESVLRRGIEILADEINQLFSDP
jgi:valine--pyruvate aminotransferase